MWLGKGLKLKEFLKLPINERRGRLWEMSDAEQLQFVERHLDWVSAILAGWPPESMLPEMEPFGGGIP
ncbi:MAG: hypothetical protein J0653_08145, partial [Deltaproteobacteria bacterium]|nr:hypothetical protein [Deltaproteobacteria bacterium]